VVTNKRIAILSNNEHSPWLKHVSEVLGSLGKLIVYAEDVLANDSAESCDMDVMDMLVVDASGLQMELAERVAWLHGRFPRVPIVVLTSSPTWRRARAVLQAGAADYMRRSLEDERLLERCHALLHCPP
jgi:DNA-binding NarL/FixJ family response regulator